MKIKGCPWCGKQPAIVRWLSKGTFWLEHECRGFLIEQNEYRAKRSAIIAWNKRHM